MMGGGMEYFAAVLAVWLTIGCAFLIFLGITALSEGKRFSGSVALLLAFVMSLVIGMILNVNYLSVAS